MKYLLTLCTLLAISMYSPVYAQNDDSSSSESVLQIGNDSDGGLKIDVDFDDEIDADEKIQKVADLISEFDSDFGRELEVELGSLSDEDKAKLIKKLDQGFTFNTNADVIPAGAVLIALPAVILIFGMPLFLLIALLGFGHRKRKQKMELVQLYINSERDIPEHVITSLDSGGSASSLKSGLTLTAVGIGVLVAFGALGAEEVGAFGLIPMFLGIARLIFWYLVERKSEGKTEQEL